MSDVVQQIKDKISIVDVVSPYVELHKAGKNFKGKSPFSAEKTPSFYVSPDRGMYYCFSTSQGGDIFNFIQAMEGVDFKGALKFLAEKAGVELVPEDPRKKQEREHLYAELEAATNFYSEYLEKEPEALEYLLERGVKKETINKWRIGYAPGPPKYGWREAKDHLESAGFKSDELLKVGLIKHTEGGKDPFDVFRDRIMFPMSNPGGKVVAFSGRILHPNDKAPKYVNSPETELYKKSELLFGYDKAKSGIRNFDFSLIVEGQFDVVMCHQAGYTNTVAVSGTALTLNHVQLLERMSRKVVLALDADRAGINAMKKGAELMLSRGLDVKIAEMPIGQDPADMIKDDPAKFKKIVGQSFHVIEFLLHVIKQEITDERSFKLKVRDEVLPFVLLLPNRIDQEHFVSKIADFIKSTTEAIRFELDRLRDRADSVLYESKNLSTTNTGKTVVNVSTSARAYLFLLAAVPLLDKVAKDNLISELDKITKISNIEEPSESDLAGTTFKLEQQFANLTKLTIIEEVVNKLNYLRTNLVRQRLSENKERLAKINGDEEEIKFTEIMKDIKKYESMLREESYQADDFLA